MSKPKRARVSASEVPAVGRPDAPEESPIHVEELVDAATEYVAMAMVRSERIAYTNRLGAGPWPGTLGEPVGDGCYWVHVTKPNGSAFATVARLGSGPDEFTLVEE